MAVKKLWEEIRACREKFEIFTISDLEFMCTDKDVVRHYRNLE